MKVFTSNTTCGLGDCIRDNAQEFNVNKHLYLVTIPIGITYSAGTYMRIFSTTYTYWTPDKYLPN